MKDINWKLWSVRLLIITAASSLLIGATTFAGPYNVDVSGWLWAIPGALGLGTIGTFIMGISFKSN